MDLAKVGHVYSRAEPAADAIIRVARALFATSGGLRLLFHVTGLSVVASVSIYCAGLPYQKAIWHGHGFVLAAAILHFTAIAHEFATALP